MHTSNHSPYTPTIHDLNGYGFVHGGAILTLITHAVQKHLNISASNIKRLHCQFKHPVPANSLIQTHVTPIAASTKSYHVIVEYNLNNHEQIPAAHATVTTTSSE